MIDEEEEIISCLEEIDKNFSKINRVFKEIQLKMDSIKRKNENLVVNLNPWIKFFGIDEIRESEKSQSPLIRNVNSKTISNNDKREDNSNSSLIIASPLKNPFSENESIHHSTNVASSTKISEFKNSDIIDESQMSSLAEFDIEILPEIFKKESEIVDLYNYIKENKKVSVKDIYSRYESEDDQRKVGIILELLVRKRFIKHADGFLYVKN